MPLGRGRTRAGVLPTLGVTPYAALQAQVFHTPAYSESDVSGGGFGLSYARQRFKNRAQRWIADEVMTPR